MSPQELINNLAALHRRGAFDNADLKAQIEEKLSQAKVGEASECVQGRRSIAGGRRFGRGAAQLEEIADTQVKARGRIARPTALLVDKSGSMELAIELGKRIAATISAICEAKLFVYAFDTLAYEIPTQQADLAAWERAFKGIKAGGGTSCGVPLAFMRRQKQYVEQIMLVTDEEENSPPLFVEEYKLYRQELSADPAVVIVRTPGASSRLEQQLRKSGSPLTYSSSRGTTTRSLTWSRSSLARRSWSRSWKSWPTRSRSANRRDDHRQRRGTGILCDFAALVRQAKPD